MDSSPADIISPGNMFQLVLDPCVFFESLLLLNQKFKVENLYRPYLNYGVNSCQLRKDNRVSRLHLKILVSVSEESRK